MIGPQPYRLTYDWPRWAKVAASLPFLCVFVGGLALVAVGAAGMAIMRPMKSIIDRIQG